MSVQTTLFVLLFLLSLAFSAFFAGAETALVSLGPIDLQRLREKGDRRGAIIRALKTNRNRLLATILIGQNLFISSASVYQKPPARLPPPTRPWPKPRRRSAGRPRAGPGPPRRGRLD